MQRSGSPALFFEIFVLKWLLQETSHAFSGEAGHDFLPVIATDQDNPYVWPQVMDAAEDFLTIEVRHSEIEQDERIFLRVGGEHIHRLAAIAG
jgi:hypothetical protein